MQVETLRPVMMAGKPVKAGEVIEVTIADGNMLIGMGKARLVTQVKAAPDPVVEAPKKSRRSSHNTED